MAIFSYNHRDEKVEFYEQLQILMERWEYETVEFKEAKGGFSEDKIGQYFSAISNEANLAGKQYGWLVLGVSEQQNKHPVGTNFKSGDVSLIEKFKYEISKNLTDGMTFLDIIELFPEYEGKTLRVLMFKIPAAVAGMPTEWNNKYYARNGDSLVLLQQFKIDAIRSQERRDWSRLIVPDAGVEHLDKDAIAFARVKYKEKMNREHISEEVDGMTDAEFLTKLKLMRDGKVTNAAMILLGNVDYEMMLQNAPVITWRLYDNEGGVKDYEHFKIPFLTVADQLFAKVRNLTYRYMPNQLSLFPMETQQYDNWLLRELLNNCIAHSNYQLGGRIYLNEMEDSIEITNPGDFLPQSIQNVLKPTYNPPFYRNQLLADAMVNFHMIDTATSGIKKIYRIQRAKFFPMPDYDLQTANQVSVTVYGKVINPKYTNILYDHPELGMETVYWIDQIQKRCFDKLTDDTISYLRKNGLVEGRKTNLILSAKVAKKTRDEIEYVKNKGFDDRYYKDMIVQLIRTCGQVTKAQVRELLWDKLPGALSDKQKEAKIKTLLTGLRQNGIIKTDSENKQRSHWILVE